ncbi:MAG: permease-like cell division protein FtsX [Candidatus Pacebacteria bacterium]|nr:permease-like cell division protein FtsX [Candidatus Paceibacterota bacterium]
MFWSRSFKRLVNSAFRDLTRNVWLNMATIVIIVIALFTVSVSLAIDAVGEYMLQSFQNKIDISVQFKDDASEEKILDLKNDLESLGEVKNVNYVSKEQALVEFQEAHSDDEYIRQSIEELGENPLFAVLNVKTNSLEQYEIVDAYLSNNDNYSPIIKEVDYQDNKNVINNFSSALENVRNGIGGLTILFVIISILIAFNTIRLAMYSHKIEIEIMRLVGASNWYIKLPFIIEGAIFGFLGAAVTMVISYIAAVSLSVRMENIFSGFYMYDYFMNNFFDFFGVLLLIGFGMGVVSSLIAVRRYLKS